MLRSAIIRPNRFRDGIPKRKQPGGENFELPK